MDDSKKVCFGRPGLNYTRIPPVHCQPPLLSRHRLPCGDVVDGYGHIVQVAPHCEEKLGVMGDVVGKAMVNAVNAVKETLSKDCLNYKDCQNHRDEKEDVKKEKETGAAKKKRRMEDEDTGA